MNAIITSRLFFKYAKQMVAKRAGVQEKALYGVFKSLSSYVGASFQGFAIQANYKPDKIMTGILKIGSSPVLVDSMARSIMDGIDFSELKSGDYINLARFLEDRIPQDKRLVIFQFQQQMPKGGINRDGDKLKEGLAIIGCDQNIEVVARYLTRNNSQADFLTGDGKFNTDAVFINHKLQVKERKYS